jgi:regulator of protease activity HflC (stomatin/prohibitin superfamily)
MDFITTIFNFLAQIWESIKFFYVINEYESGIVLRLGKFKKEVGAGLHWKIPLFDAVLTCQIATETIEVGSQSLTTIDEFDIVINSVVKYRVSDPISYLLKVRDVTDAIPDICKAKVKAVISSKTWKECKDQDLDNEITKAVRTEAKKWGIAIDYITITDLARLRTIRIING